MLNNTTTFGNGNQNLILETAGRVYIKVSDKFYELNFRDQTSNKGPAVINNNIVQKEEADLSNYITKRDLKSSLAQYITKRDWQDVKETQRKLEEALLDGFSESINPITVQTMQVIVGSEQLQFEFIEKDSLHPNGTSPYITTPHSFGIQDGRLFCNPGLILHHTVDCPDAVRPGSVSGYEGQQDTKYYCRWHVGNSEVTWFDFDSDEQSYYLYIRAEKLNLTNTQRNDPANDSIKVGNASFFLSAEPYSLDPDDGYYYFLYAIINSDNGDGRSIGTMNGFTEILPGQITAYIFKSADGIQFVDFLNKQFHIGYAPGPGEIATTGTVDNGSYMHWDSHNGLVIKGNITVTGGDLQDTLDDLQRQIDDEVQAWFSSDSNNTNPAGHKHDRPTNDNWPANEWTTDSLKKEHSGDLYYIVDGTYEGETYRYAKVDSSYAWVVVSDSSVAEALRVAYEAMGLAEENEAKLNSWIDDGVISPTEISGIKEEYEFIQSDYDNLAKEKDLYGLGSSTEWTNYQSAYTLYYNWLNKIIYSYDNADPDVLDEYGNVDLSEVASKYSSVLTDTFANAMSNYYDKRTIFYKHAATTISSGISTAISAAANAQTTADNVTTYVGRSLADDVLSKDEIEVLQTYKKSLADQYTAISSSYTDLIAQASAILQDPDFDHSSSAYINLNAAYLALTTANTGSYAVLSSAYTSLVNSVDAILNCGMTAVGTTDSRLHSLKTAFDTAASTFSTAIAAYIDDVQELNVYIADANKYITIEGYRYLTEAIVNGTTTIAGGLVATNTIVLGNTPQSSGYKVTAGINGITTINNVEDTTAIAAWYGGPFRDKSYYYTWDFDDGWVLKPAYISNPPSASDYAQTVFRHNGSGYVAGGAIAWDIDGSGSVANGALYWNASGIPTIAGGLEIDLTEGGQLTLLQIANTVASLSSWFVKDTTTMPGKTLLRINMGSQQSTGFDGVIWDGFLVTGGDQIVLGGTPGSGGGGGGATYLPDLRDVDDALASPSANAILQYNSSTHLWEGHTPATQIGMGVSELTTGELIRLVLGDNFNSNWTVKEFINSSVATATATYRGNYNEKTDLNLNPSATRAQIATKLTTVVSNADDNDYCFVEIPTSANTPMQIERTERYKYSGSSWSYEYTLNNSGFTAVQWDAINSGITSGKITTYDTLYGYFANGTTLGVANGGTGKSSWTKYGVVYASGTGTLAQVSNNTEAKKKFLRMTGTGSAGNTPAWDTVAYGDLPAMYIGNAAVQNGPQTAQNIGGLGILTLANGKAIDFLNSPAEGETAVAWSVLQLSTTNKLFVGLDSSKDGAETYLYGSTIYLRYGTGHYNGLIIDSTALTSYRDIIPSANGTRSLGSSSAMWKYTYTNRLYLTSSVYIEYDTSGNYVHINAPLVTDGDQIVTGGTPGGGGGGGATWLNDLQDVTCPLPTANDVLQYNGSQWVNVPSTQVGITTAGTVEELNASSPANDKKVWSPYVLATWLSGKNFVTNVAIGTSTHNEELVVTKGSTTSYLTVPYATTVKRFKRYEGTETEGGYDLDTLLQGGGITSQYHRSNTWANGPTNMSFGSVVQIQPNNNVTGTLSMQLAWDIINNSMETGKLWWRDRGYNNSTSSAWWGSWHLIYDNTTLKLNEAVGTDTPLTFYAPTSSGTVGQILKSSGTGVAPVWTSSALGSATKNIYLNSSGILTEGNTYAGGTKVTLNNSDKGSSTASFYAPTGAGTSGQVLTSGGSGIAPSWVNQNTLSAGKDGDGNTISSTYVKLNPGSAEQTISSNIGTFEKGVVNLWRKSGDHYTFLGFSNGTTETYLGGIGFKSQSDHNLYRKDVVNNSNVYYKIFDASNANLSTIDWTAKDLTAAGALSVTGAASVNKLTIASTAGEAHIALGRGGYNYITTPASGVLNIVTGGRSLSLANSTAVFTDTDIRPGANATYSLGTGTYCWEGIYGRYLELKKNGGASLVFRGTTTLNNQVHTILFKGGTDTDSNGFKIETVPATSYGRQGLGFYTSDVHSGSAPYTPDWKRTLYISHGGTVYVGATDHANQLVVYGTATIGTATAASGAALTVNGVIASSGDQVITSDIRVKKNLIPIELTVEQIASCRAVTFDWITGGHSFGSVAQDWESILPEAVIQGDIKSLAYGQLGLIAAINIAKHDTEQDREINRLKELLYNANDRIEYLEKEVKQLKNMKI